MKESRADINLFNNISPEYLRESLHKTCSIIKITSHSFHNREYEFIDLYVRQNDRFHRNFIDSIAYKRLTLSMAP